MGFKAIKERFKKNLAIVKGKKITKKQAMKEAVEEGKKRKKKGNIFTGYLAGSSK